LVDVLEDRGRAYDVEVRVLLAGEGVCRQALRRRAGSHGAGGMLAELAERPGDRRREITGNGDPFDGPADLRAERANRLPVVRVQARQRIEPTVDRRRSARIRPKASVVTQKSAGTRVPSIRGSPPRCAPLPPTDTVRQISKRTYGAGH
jgi:hypothetical protein